MRRRALLQLLGLAGVAASVDPSGVIRLNSDARSFKPIPEASDDVLNAMEPGLWCKYGGVDLSPWLLDLALVREPIEVTIMSDTTHRFIASPNATIELDLMLPDQDTRAALHEIWLGHINAVLEFGDTSRGRRIYSVNAYTKLISADATPEITRMGIRLLPSGVPQVLIK